MIIWCSITSAELRFINKGVWHRTVYIIPESTLVAIETVDAVGSSQIFLPTQNLERAY